MDRKSADDPEGLLTIKVSSWLHRAALLRSLLTLSGMDRVDAVAISGYGQTSDRGKIFL
jgi:hypothetical protein